MSDSDFDLQAVSILPPTAARLVRLGSEIAMEPPTRPDFLHSVLCQVGLPRRRVAGDTFERMNGNVSLLVEAGKLWNGKEWQPQPLPYGTRPRLALVHVSSEAVRTKSPTVEVGHSAREFLLRLGIGTGGEEYANFNRQLRALAACRMSLGVGLETLDTKPIKRFAAWASKNDKQRALWPGVIELTREFYESLAEYAVPLDPRALAALKHSALAHRIHGMAGIRRRVSRKLLIAFTDWVSRPTSTHNRAAPHPPCPMIRPHPSSFQPSAARSSPPPSMAAA